MTLRMDLTEKAPKQYAVLVAFDRSIELDPRLRELVSLRASQMNGCAFCVNLHWKRARTRGESDARLDILDAWRESRLFSDRERTALALCEAITRVADDGVSDDVWRCAAQQFGADELAQLVFAITAINALNRLAIVSGRKPRPLAAAGEDAA